MTLWKALLLVNALVVAVIPGTTAQECLTLCAGDAEPGAPDKYLTVVASGNLFALTCGQLRVFGPLVPEALESCDIDGVSIYSAWCECPGTSGCDPCSDPATAVLAEPSTILVPASGEAVAFTCFDGHLAASYVESDDASCPALASSLVEGCGGCVSGAYDLVGDRETCLATAQCADGSDPVFTDDVEVDIDSTGTTATCAELAIIIDLLISTPDECQSFINSCGCKTCGVCPDFSAPGAPDRTIPNTQLTCGSLDSQLVAADDANCQLLTADRNLPFFCDCSNLTPTCGICPDLSSPVNGELQVDAELADSLGLQTATCDDVNFIIGGAQGETCLTFQNSYIPLDCGCEGVTPTCLLCGDRALPNENLELNTGVTCGDVEQQFIRTPDANNCLAIQDTAGFYCGCPRQSSASVCRICGGDIPLPEPGLLLEVDAETQEIDSCASLEYYANLQGTCAESQALYSTRCNCPTLSPLPPSTPTLPPTPPPTAPSLLDPGNLGKSLAPAPPVILNQQTSVPSATITPVVDFKLPLVSTVAMFLYVLC